VTPLQNLKNGKDHVTLMRAVSFERKEIF